jgi:hypothetical protein
MKTLEEIKEIIYPKVEIDLVEITKDLLVQKYGEGKLVTFGENHLYDVGDPILTLNGLAVVNNQLIAMTYLNYGGNSCGDIFGTVFNGEELDEKKGIGVSNTQLLKICQKLFKGGKKIHVEFDFTTMKGTDDEWETDSEWLEKNLTNNKDFLKILKGKSGYVEL